MGSRTTNSSRHSQYALHSSVPTGVATTQGLSHHIFLEHASQGTALYVPVNQGSNGPSSYRYKTIRLLPRKPNPAVSGPTLPTYRAQSSKELLSSGGPAIRTLVANASQRQECCPSGERAKNMGKAERTIGASPKHWFPSNGPATSSRHPANFGLARIPLVRASRPFD